MRLAAVLITFALAACGDDDDQPPAAADAATAADAAADAAAANDAAADAGVDATTCPGDFVPAANAGCYLAVETAGSWLSARGQCTAMGAILAQADETGENDAIAALVGFDAWLGGYDAVAEGAWLWVDGQPVLDQPWAPGQPDDAAPGEDCLLLLADGTWSDHDCAEMHGYICEMI